MCRVSDKILLCLKSVAYPAKQQVELLYQRAYLVWEAGVCERRKIICSAARHVTSGALYGRQRPVDHPPHRQHEQRCQEHKRQHRPGGERLRACCAGTQILRNLDGLLRCLQRIHAITAAIGLHL